MGYHLNSEGELKGDYCVMALETARGMFLYREIKPSTFSAPKRVGRVFRAGGPTTFPLYVHFERVNQGVGREGGRYDMGGRVRQPPQEPLLRSAHPPGEGLEAQEAPPLPPPMVPPSAIVPDEGVGIGQVVEPHQLEEAQARADARPDILGKLDAKNQFPFKIMATLDATGRKRAELKPINVSSEDWGT